MRNIKHREKTLGKKSEKSDKEIHELDNACKGIKCHSGKRLSLDEQTLNKDGWDLELSADSREPL